MLSRKEGQFVFYSLNTTVLDEVLGWLVSLKKMKKMKHNANWNHYFGRDRTCHAIPLSGHDFGLIAPGDSTSLWAQWPTRSFWAQNGNIYPIVYCWRAGLVSWLLVSNLHKIDPKKTAEMAREQGQKMGIGILVFMSAIRCISCIRLLSRVYRQFYFCGHGAFVCLDG